MENNNNFKHPPTINVTIDDDIEPGSTDLSKYEGLYKWSIIRPGALQNEDTDTLKVRRVDEKAVLPTRAHPDDAGLDLYASQDGYIDGQDRASVLTGIAIEIPPGHFGMVADRSSMGGRGLKTSGGIIDSNYRGEIKVILNNLSKYPILIRAGDKIAQLLIIPVSLPKVVEVDSLSDSDRGTNGFGSTGK